MILLSGGTDGGDTRRVVEMAEILLQPIEGAAGRRHELPVIYAATATRSR